MDCESREKPNASGTENHGNKESSVKSSLLGTELQDTAKKMGYETAREYLADRFYDEG